MHDDTWDDAFVASAFVSWHTAPSEDGSYIPMTEEEASRTFFDWLREVKAEAWDEGQHAGGCEGYSHGEPEPNPYRD